MKKHSSGEKAYVNLQQAARKVLDYPLTWPGQKNLVLSCAERTPPISKSRVKTLLAALRRGEPVPFDFAVAFEDYLRGKYKDKWPLKASSDVWEPAMDPERVAEEEGAWYDWNSVKDALLAKFQVAEEMYLYDPPDDMPALAEIIVRRVGEMVSLPDDPMGAEESLARGEKWMQRSVAEYSAWLLAMHGRDKHAVMHVVQRSGSGGAEALRRIGVTVAFGITKSAYDRFCSGDICDKDLTPADLQSPAEHVFLNALVRRYNADDLTVAEVSSAEVNAILLQGAYFTRGMRPLQPRAVTFGGTPKFKDRLLRQGFHDTRRRMRGFDVPVLTLGPPTTLLPLSHHFSYTMMWFAYHMCRMANVEQWDCSLDTPWGS